jgi:hypothetical protein
MKITARYTRMVLAVRFTVLLYSLLPLPVVSPMPGAVGDSTK